MEVEQRRADQERHVGKGLSDCIAQAGSAGAAIDQPGRLGETIESGEHIGESIQQQCCEAVREASVGEQGEALISWIAPIDRARR